MKLYKKGFELIELVLKNVMWMQLTWIPVMDYALMPTKKSI